MSVKSDNWIIHQCTRPTHRVHDRMEISCRLIAPPFNDEEQRLIDNWCSENNRDIYGNKPYAMPVSVEDVSEWKPMIFPFYDSPVRYVCKSTGEPKTMSDENTRKVISFGTSSYGYDVRLKADPDQIKVFSNVLVSEIDPKRIKGENFAVPSIRTDDDGAKYVMIPAHSYIQAPTMEYFHIPRDILVIVLGKSTYARSALICNVTPIEPEFEGNVLIQITNPSDKHIRVYLEEGIASFLFTLISK